jgi:hypothetical protein
MDNASVMTKLMDKERGDWITSAFAGAGLFVVGDFPRLSESFSRSSEEP